MRESLPSRRKSVTWKFRVVSVSGVSTTIHFTVGFYADGRVGEVFIDMHKQGAALRDWASKTAMLVSVLLQMGMPLEEVSTHFLGQQAEPAGRVELYPKLLMCSSVMDCIMRILLIEYNGRKDLIESNCDPLPLPGQFLKVLQHDETVVHQFDDVCFDPNAREIPELSALDHTIWAIDFDRLNEAHRELRTKIGV